MKINKIFLLTTLFGSILVCDPAEGIKNQLMSPHGGHYKNNQTKGSTSDTHAQTPSTSTPSSQNASPSQDTTSNIPSTTQDPDLVWTNKYDIKVIYIPYPQKTPAEAELTLNFDNKEHNAPSLKLKNNPLIIPKGSLKAFKVDLSDAHHNKEGKVIDANGKIVPSGSIKSPDGFETYVDRNPLPPGIVGGFSYYPIASGKNNGMFTIPRPDLKAIVFAATAELQLDYLQKNYPNSDIRDTLDKKVALVPLKKGEDWDQIRFVY